MKLNRKITRLAASMLATAMFACATALPAMADDNESTPGVSQGASFTVTKNLEIPANIAVPEVTFSFTVAKADPDPNDRPGTETGKDDAVKAGTATFTATDGTDYFSKDAPYTVSKTVDFSVDISKFDHAGIYKYTVRETQGNTTGITYDDDVKNLYVYVENDDSATTTNNLKIAYTELVDDTQPSGTANKKTATFDNSYLNKDEPSPTLSHTLVLSKKIDGELADLSDTFTFPVTLTNGDGNEYYYETGTVDEAGNFTADGTQGKYEDQLLSGSNESVTLGNNKAIKIYGLLAGDAFAIQETAGNTNGYVTTAVVNNGSETTYGTGEGYDSFGENNGVSGSIGSNDVTVKYTNTRSSVTPTGVIMNVAPYVLMVVIAAAGCFVFLRKRRDD